MTIGQWLQQDGIAMTANEKVITSSPIVIEHNNLPYAGWMWSDGLKTFAHNAAGSAFILDREVQI